MNTKGNISWSFEDEDGISPLGVPCSFEFELDFVFWPGEKMVMYYPDGSGYPGSPPEIEITKVALIKTFVECDGPELNIPSAKQLEKWFADYLDTHELEYNRVCEKISENLAQD